MVSSLFSRSFCLASPDQRSISPASVIYESFLVFIRKTDAIWQQSFNDHMKKYKFVDGQIIRTPDV
jgi:hypothetical protein